MPSRKETSATISQAAYSIALEGVSRFSLETAARKILQGHLKHAFFPSPAEIRMVCDEVSRSVAEDAYRDKVTRQSISEARPVNRPTPEVKARMAALWKKTKADNAAADPDKKDNTPETAKDRLEALAAEKGSSVDWDKIPDKKEVESNWQRPKASQ